MEQMRAALSELAPGIELAGISDLVINGRKFSGNSQQRKRNHLLHHGTILYDFDIERIGRYLRMPGRQPEYRRGRDHATFLMNLPLPAAELHVCLQSAWSSVPVQPDTHVGLIQELVANKYGSQKWISRR